MFCTSFSFCERIDHMFSPFFTLEYLQTRVMFSQYTTYSEFPGVFVCVECDVAFVLVLRVRFSHAVTLFC